MLNPKLSKLEEIRGKEREYRKTGKKNNINTPEMQDLRWHSYGKARKQLMPAMIAMYDYICDKVTGDNFLDVGCGEAALIWQLVSNGKCNEYYGIDISQIRIVWNNEKLKTPEFSHYDNIYFLFSYAEELPFPNEYMDIVVCTVTIEHITYPKKAIDEIMRVLKKEGCALFGIPIEADPTQYLKSPDHYHFWKSEEEILSLFKDYNVISTKFIDPNLIIEVNK